MYIHINVCINGSLIECAYKWRQIFHQSPSSTLISVIVLSNPHPSPSTCPLPFLPPLPPPPSPLHPFCRPPSPSNPHPLTATPSPRHISHCRPSSQEYKVAMETIAPIVAKHKAELIPGDPQLNYCDNALQVSMYLCVLYSAWLLIQYVCIYQIYMYITCVRDGKYVCTYV